MTECAVCKARVPMQEVGLRMYAKDGCIIPWNCRANASMQQYLQQQTGNLAQAAAEAEEMARTGDTQGFSVALEALANSILDEN